MDKTWPKVVEVHNRGAEATEAPYCRVVCHTDEQVDRLIAAADESGLTATAHRTSETTDVLTWLANL